MAHNTKIEEIKVIQKQTVMNLNKLSTLRLSKEELLANQKVLEEAKKIPRQVVVLPKGNSYNKGY